jgi:hypothetical protein
MTKIVPGETKYSDAELIEALQLYAAQLGRPPTLREMDRNPEVPSGFTYKYRFGSWAQALRRALGEDTPMALARTQADEAKLRHDIRQLAAQLGRAPSVSEMNGVDDAYHANTYIRRYGSWTAAVEHLLRE